MRKNKNVTIVSKDEFKRLTTTRYGLQMRPAKNRLRTIGKFLHHDAWLFWPFVGWVIWGIGNLILTIADGMEGEKA